MNITQEQIDFLCNLYPKIYEDMTIPNNSKLFFCKNTKYSRDFVRNSGVINCSIKRDSSAADFCIFDERILQDICYSIKQYPRRTITDNGDNTFSINYLSIYCQEHLQSILEIEDTTKLITKAQLHRAFNKNMILDDSTKKSIISMLTTNSELGTTILSKYCPMEEVNYLNYMEILNSVSYRIAFDSVSYKDVIENYVYNLHSLTTESKIFGINYNNNVFNYNGISENISINKTLQFSSISNWLTNRIKESFIEYVKDYNYIGMIENVKLTFDTNTSYNKIETKEQDDE